VSKHGLHREKGEIFMQNEYDILVIGGGLCGFACAMESAQNGKKVLLTERRPALGWESTWAYQLDFDGDSSEINQTILANLNAVGGLKNGITDAPILEMTLDKLAEDAGISVLLYSYPVRLIFEDDTAYGVVLGSKSGEQIIKARVVIDATEEALLWKQTFELDLAPNPVPCMQTIFFNHAEADIDLPCELEDGISLYPSIWDSEIRVQFEIEENELLTARRKIPEVVELVRENVPQLKQALVSHTGNETFPLKPLFKAEEKAIKHPTIKNFLGAGIWSEQVENTPTGRLALGEKVGKMVSECEGVKQFPPDDEMMTGSLFKPSEIMSDVIVIGGGTSGSIAAIASAREGVKTTLIEALTFLGGIGTGGAIHSYCAGIKGGIQDEVDQRVAELTPLLAGKWEVSGFHPEAKKIVLQQMAEEAGVDIIFNTVMTGVLLKEGKVEAKPQKTAEGTSIAVSEKEGLNELIEIIAVGQEGVAVYRANVFIDSTGDGDVAAMSGAPFILGREKDNLTHAFSQPAGKLEQNGRLSFLNFDAGYTDPTDVKDLTRARRLGIRHYWQDKFTNENRKLYIAPIIGLRQSRQIIGEYQLTLADEISGRRFDDAISFTKTFYDNHGFDYENESDEAILWVWALGSWRRTIGCEVPYRCLLPQNVDRLLLACRAISLTYDAHAGFRMQRDLQRIGEAAGLAAAMAAKENVSPREIELEKLQAFLKQRGVLDEKYRPQPAIPEYKATEIPELDSLDSEKAKEVALVSIPKSSDSALVLRDMLSSETPDIRFKASAVLALHGIDEGVPQLIKFVKDRVDEKPEGNKTVPMWEAAIPFLGMARDKKAVPVLIGVLKDKKSGLDTLIAAVRALGQIGEKSVIPELKELLRREDLPTKRIFQVSSGGVKPVVEDARWQIELAVAETLSKLGEIDKEIRKIVEPHLNDKRAYVRRYAKKIV